MKNKKVLLIAHLTDVSSVKLPLRSCYGVSEFGLCDLPIYKANAKVAALTLNAKAKVHKLASNFIQLSFSFKR